MKKIVKTLAFLLIGLGVLDFVLSEFMDTYITSQYYEIGSLEKGDLSLVYWTPYVFGLLGIILYYINIYILKPENVNMSDDSVSQAMTYFKGVNNKTEGKIYVTPEKITFDGSDSFDISYDDIISVSKTKTMKIFPSIEIKTNNENYIFTGAIGRNKIINAINNFKKKS